MREVLVFSIKRHAPLVEKRHQKTCVKFSVWIFFFQIVKRQLSLTLLSSTCDINLYLILCTHMSCLITILSMHMPLNVNCDKKDVVEWFQYSFYCDQAYMISIGTILNRHNNTKLIDQLENVHFPWPLKWRRKIKPKTTKFDQVELLDTVMFFVLPQFTRAHHIKPLDIHVVHIYYFFTNT